MLLKNKKGVRQWDIEPVLDVEVLNQEQKYGFAKIVHLKVILLVFLMVVVAGLVLVDALDVEGWSLVAQISRAQHMGGVATAVAELQPSPRVADHPPQV